MHLPITIKKSEGGERGYLLQAELRVAEPREKVFEMFADAFQLEAITPPSLRFSVLTPPPIDMRVGTLIDYRLRLHGLPMRWRSKISVWDPPHEFVDEQVYGPYRRWRHRHIFESLDNGTLIRDEVHYDVPLAVLAHPLLVRRDLLAVFEFRQQALSRIFTPLQRVSTS
jgi:ligand-binding SRPBCC domain-containing protein